MRIGIAGMGKMGSAIAARLHEQGEDVIVWNRTRHKAEATSLPVAKTPRGLAERSDVIISIVFDDEAQRAVFHGPDGLMASAAGRLFIDMSTVSSDAQQGLERAVLAAGGDFLECPVGGTTAPAREGQLLGLAGGSQTAFARAHPVLTKLCRRVELLGPVGSGALAKLAINLPLAVFWQSFGEALTLVRRLDKDPAWLVQLFSETAGAANVLKAKATAVADAMSGMHVEPSFSIDAMRKDLRMMVAQAAKNGEVLPVASQTLDAISDVIEAESGSLDCACLPALWLRKVASDVL